MKKILLLMTAFLFFVFPVFAQGEKINSFTSNIVVNKNGMINVKETIVYDFSDLQKHGIYRDIPTIKTNKDGKKYKLDFSNFKVTDQLGDNYRYTTTWSDDKISLKIGDQNYTITGVHTYVISYKVSGALTYFSDHDELNWNVTGNEWTVPIASTTASVVWPQEIKKEDIKTTCYTGTFGSTESECQIQDDRTITNFRSEKILSANEGMTIVVSIPKNIVAVLEPKEYVPFSQTLIGKLFSLIIGLFVLIWYIGLPAYIIFHWTRRGRDPKATVGEVAAWYDPPKSPKENRFLTPGEVGTLGDETVDLKDISATVVDLARRGYLKIEERKKGDFYFVRRIKKDQLLDYEKKLLDRFFKDDKEIRIKGSDLFSEIEEVKNSLYDDTVAQGLFPENPQKIRTKYYILAAVALFTGNFFLAIVAFIFGRVMPRKTQEGANAHMVANSLKNFLTTQKRELEFQANKQLMFERLLPYAIAFGVEGIWAKRFQDFDIKSPSWYSGYYPGSTFNSLIFVSSLSSSMQSFATAATPTRSSSGFSSGFGGGGFSGGGGGGGGGGSW